MLTKDQLFSVHEFVIAYSSEKLWRVGDKLMEVAPELLVTDAQKMAMNNFILKNGRNVVSEIQGSIHALFKELDSPTIVVEPIVVDEELIIA